MSKETSMHVVHAIAGDATSTGWLIAHFRGFVDAQVRLRLRGQCTQQDVEDVAADVWVVAIQRLPDIRPRDDHHAAVLVRFLGTTVLGVCNNFLRKRARTVARQGRFESAGEADDFARQSRSIMSRMILGESSSIVDKALAQLTPEYRDVLVMRLMEQRSNQEIGTLLGIPANTVAVRFRRAIETLRSCLPPTWCEDLLGNEPAGDG